MKLHFYGEVQDCLEALDILLPVLGFENTANAWFQVKLVKGEGIKVQIGEAQAEITYGSRSMLCRALSHLHAHIGENDFYLAEKPVFDTNGIMMDCSRNLVLTVDAAKTYLRKLALMGMNFAMLYTEDTYEIEGEPYFGYMRGRYSAEEIKEIDDYAFALGIELVPCIQTLGHMTHMLKWDVYNDVKNTLDILLIEEEKTYAFLEKAIRAVSTPYRSKRIHIGLDEADDLAEGIYRKYHGIIEPVKVMHRHVARVLEIVKKLGLEPMMWSDMYFTPVFGEYYEPKRNMPQEIIDSVQKDVQLVFWDYYHDEITRYDHMFDLHRQLGNDTIFAGGVYTWLGLFPDYKKTLDTMIPALYSAINHGIKEVFATLWFNDGAECSAFAALYGCQLFAEFGYTGKYDEEQLKRRFKECCGADADAFLELTDFDYLTDDEIGDEVKTKGSPKRSKNLLYEDPLMPLFEKDFEHMDLVSYYSEFEKKYMEYADTYPEYKQLFEFAAQMGRLLHDKCIWRIEAPAAVRAKDRKKAGELALFAQQLKVETEEFLTAWRILWHTYNKPFGFELNDIRVGGMAARFDAAAQKMAAYAAGELEDIEELSCEKLPFSRNVPGAPKGCVRKQKWHSMATVNTMGGYTNLRS